MAKTFDLNGAVRYADYSVTGGATTWKVGIDWHVTDDLRVRSTRSQDIRAPTLNDLFQPVSRTGVGYTDLHTNVSATVASIGQGNPNLVPEVAQTLTVGVVYRPTFLPGFSVSLDYFDIKMANAITNVAGTNQNIQAACENSNNTSPLCTLYARPLPFSDHTPANFPTAVYSSPQNVAETWTHGYDLEVNYAFDLANVYQPLPGRMSLRLLSSYQPVNASITLPGQPVINAAGAANNASIKINVAANYTVGPVNLAWSTRWRGAEKRTGDPTLVWATPDIPSVAFSDVTATYRFKAWEKDVSAYLTVQNVFDQIPPAHIANSSVPNFGNNVVNGDDLIGRYYTAGLRLRF